MDDTWGGGGGGGGVSSSLELVGVASLSFNSRRWLCSLRVSEDDCRNILLDITCLRSNLRQLGDRSMMIVSLFLMADSSFWV